MKKTNFTSLAILSLSLAACGGGGSSSSSSSDTEQTDNTPTPEVQPSNFCEAVDNTILVAEGSQCTLTPEQKDKLPIPVDSDEARCSNGQIQIGNFTAGSLAGNDFAVRCEGQELDLSAYRVSSTDDIITADNSLLDLFVTFDRVTAEGNAEVIIDEGTSYPQVHANMKNGEFWFFVESSDFGSSLLFDSELEKLTSVIMLYSGPEVETRTLIDNGFSGLPGVIFDDVVNIDNSLNVKCTYNSLSEVTCGSIALDLSEQVSALPAILKVHFLGCHGETYECKSGISLPVQFN
ncbi:hypothetical protein CHH28_13385 [Bacterioplanes sanyensis]|uniref:Lipoprotein n=1 Tax=Bacterioplanes sanyensis TaxID=1249553 RepID=A0A222FLQ7_9GAMM|nr:hypothetical protein [Bacterioplanes sanyensis]ASP39602.1 hypothetical protein CHH28_13385 [Bacterioplanes sanyensis]